jgi:hypothetical protein
MIERLSAKDIKTAGPGTHCDGGGLYLQVTPKADGGMSRSWIFRYAPNGRVRQMGLGPTHTVTLAKGREDARQARLLLLERIDPIEHRDGARAQKGPRSHLQ